ncbi:MAG: MBL fold metallo-hydrolase [Bacilli bacterium]|nr:MBL fold metallo-hydrolase [Bacilli bacterium]
MNLDNIIVNTQSSIKINLSKIIYFDPYKIDKEYNDADIIFITHNHYDHMDEESIMKVKNDNTIIVAPKSMEDVIKKIDFKEYIFLEPFENKELDGISINTIPAYNIDKPFHPRSNNWLGYIINIDNVTYYVAGDTDATPEIEDVKCDIAFIPIGGHFTMDVNEATELIKKMNTKIVIPIHYGSIIGNITDGKDLTNNLSDYNIDVIEKLKFN